MILSECLPNLEKELLEEVEEHSSIKKFAAQDVVIEQGEIIHFLPIVMDGGVKVFSDEESVQFLLYYVSTGETCIFSFAHIFNEEPVEFSAVAEVDSELLLLPTYKVREWYSTHTSFSNVLIKAYQKHYNDLLHTTKQVVCYNLEERLSAYLKKRVQIEGSDVLRVSHQEIANDLGTSREVITRLMKKLSSNEEVVQVGRKIKVL